MEETINTTAEATESGAEGFGGNEVNISDLLTEEPQGTVEAPGAENAQEPITRSDGAEPERPIQNQTDFNAALKTRLAEKEATVSRRYTSSPEYQLGKMMLAERMQKDGVSAEVAAQRIRQERIEQRAQQYKQDHRSSIGTTFRAKPNQPPRRKRSQRRMLRRTKHLRLRSSCTMPGRQESCRTALIRTSTSRVNLFPMCSVSA